jgi:hypothetical protein
MPAGGWRETVFFSFFFSTIEFRESELPLPISPA